MLLLITAPPLEIPVPLIVNASAFVIVWPLRSRTAPEVIVVPAAVVPKAVALPSLSVPALMVVAPV